MINALKSSPLLKGADGERPVNIGFIIESLQRLSQLTTDFSVISELDINPLIAHDNPRECKIADARIVLKKSRRKRFRKGLHRMVFPRTINHLLLKIMVGTNIY